VWGRAEKKRMVLKLLAQGLGYGVAEPNERVGLVNKVKVVNWG
jgi:hypothetical protein